MTNDDLSHMSAAEIDALPFGYIALAADGTVRKYNRYEADLARKDPADVLGKNFFREVAPCTQVQDFEGRFRDFAGGEIEDPTLSFQFEFPFQHGSQKVRIGFVRSPLEREVIVTVNRVRDYRLAPGAEIDHDPERGRLADAGARPVVAAGSDFWRALHQLAGAVEEADRPGVLHQMGKAWGQGHALRVERWVQRREGKTLREAELQLALEALSGSLGVSGLGRFDLDLDFRSRGVLRIHHGHSPFPEMLERDGPCCDVLAGVHAGFLTHLSGREVAAREISCSRKADQSCVFLAGTEPRLEALLEGDPRPEDANLRLALGLAVDAS